MPFHFRSCGRETSYKLRGYLSLQKPVYQHCLLRGFNIDFNNSVGLRHIFEAQ